MKSKRLSKCPGCGHERSLHTWGSPNIHCTGKDQEAGWLQNQVQEPSEDHLAAALADTSPGLHPKSPSTTINIAERTSEYDEDEAALAVQLEQLKLKRVRLQKQQRCQALCAAIAQEQQYVEWLRNEIVSINIDINIGLKNTN